MATVPGLAALVLIARAWDGCRCVRYPIAQGFLHQFADAPPEQRLQMAHQIMGMPDAQPYLVTMENVAKICNKY